MQEATRLGSVSEITCAATHVWRDT